MANKYWYDAKLGAATTGLLGGLNWNAQTDAGGAWSALGAGDTGFMETDYGGGDGDSSDCNVDANVTVVTLNLNAPNEESEYEGTFTIDGGVTLTLTQGAEWEGALVVSGTLDTVLQQTFCPVTGAGAITVSGDISGGTGTDYSGYTGTFTWDGAGSQECGGQAASLPDWIMNGAGTLTLAADLSSDDITMTNGTLALDTFDLDAGSISGTGGTLALDGGLLRLS
ncbi:hypothetical protein LCGC14_1881280, partial [marine sediment metagenome]